MLYILARYIFAYYIREYIIRAMTCPVRKAISEIRGGGFAFDDDNSALVAVVGGGCEVVVDEVSFVISRKRLELARLELSQPSLEVCQKKYASSNAGRPAVEVYKKLAEEVFCKTHDQLIEVVDILGELEECISGIVAHAAKCKQPINISLPVLALPITSAREVTHNLHALYETVNEICRYVSRINLNSLVDIRVPRLEALGQPPNIAPNFDPAQISSGSAEDVPGYISLLRRILDDELRILEYLRKAEPYHCEALKKLGEVKDYCTKIIGAVLDYRLKWHPLPRS